MNVENPNSVHSGILTDRPTGRAPETEEERHQEHFKTDHLLRNLKGHTISSGAVTVSAQGAKFILSLVSTMVLARLLMPRDFGLVAMVTTVTSFLRVFKDAGLSIATVQRERITHAQGSNLFLDKSRRKRLVRAYSSRFVADRSAVLSRLSNNTDHVGSFNCLPDSWV